eukprot:1139417-Pelagomonas_calceolata.AAC.2
MRHAERLLAVAPPAHPPGRPHVHGLQHLVAPAAAAAAAEGVLLPACARLQLLLLLLLLHHPAVFATRAAAPAAAVTIAVAAQRRLALQPRCLLQWGEEVLGKAEWEDWGAGEVRVVVVEVERVEQKAAEQH